MKVNFKRLKETDLSNYREDAEERMLDIFEEDKEVNDLLSKLEEMDLYDDVMNLMILSYDHGYEDGWAD